MKTYKVFLFLGVATERILWVCICNAYRFTDAKMQHNLLHMNKSDVENEITNFE